VPAGPRDGLLTGFGEVAARLVEATATLLRIGKETTIGADDDRDPSQPVSPAIVYIAPECPADRA
jgi:hypothetical protein